MTITATNDPAAAAAAERPKADTPALLVPAKEEIWQAKEEEVYIVDLFCGAGGSSTGAERAIEEIGKRMKLKAVNHWPVAVETHKLNHPEADHYIEDVEHADPPDHRPRGLPGHTPGLPGMPVFTPGPGAASPPTTRAE